ncbi:MAG: amidohydrolase family protein, partial [Planctomycetota bacterium]|nr:amidohydrolase family protein [Planctomycetota bacterium]
MRYTTLLTALCATSLVVADLSAQRRRGRRGDRGGPPTAQVPTKPEKKKAAPKKPKPLVAYTNATVHVGDTTVYRRATVLLEGDKISEVGPQVEIPKRAKTIDCKGQHICPGFFILKGVNVGAPRSVRGEEKYGDGINPFHPMMKRALAVGITSYLTMSATSGKAPTGSSAVIKLVPGSIEGIVVKSPAIHAMSVPLGPEGWRKLKASVEKAKKYKKELADYEKKKAAGDKAAKKPKEDKSLAALLSVMDGKTRLQINSSSTPMFRSGGRMRFGGSAMSMRVPHIREALQVGKLFGAPVVLDNPSEAWIVADEIAAAKGACVLLPRSQVAPDPKVSEPNGSTIHACAILSEAGVPVAVLPGGGMFGSGIGNGGILGQDLNTPTLDPCFAIRGGMDAKEALSTITLYPAMLAGVDDRIGSLEVGKDADL